MAERGNRFALAVCEALGVDASEVTRVEIVADATDVLKVTVNFKPTVSGGERMTEALMLLAADTKVVRLEGGRPLVSYATVVSDKMECG